MYCAHCEHGVILSNALKKVMSCHVFFCELYNFVKNYVLTFDAEVVGRIKNAKLFLQFIYRFKKKMKIFPIRSRSCFIKRKYKYICYRNFENIPPTLKAMHLITLWRVFLHQAGRLFKGHIVILNT